MKITEYLKENILYLDGAMGTLLQSAGLALGELPELWNLTHPEEITKIHRAYYDAGSNVVSTNTFGANSIKFSDDELSKIVKAAVENARAAKESCKNPENKWIALDIGPLGKLLKPYGELDFEEAVSIFSKTARLGEKYGVDLIFIETMSDSYETKAALLAAKESTRLPVFVSNAYGEDGKLMTGATPAAMVAMLEGLGADAIGVNCSLGPRALYGVVSEYLKYSSVPVILKPNAGLPRTIDGVAVYDTSANDFANEARKLIIEGVRIAGGCCGTTPEYISELVNSSRAATLIPIEKKNFTIVSSYTHAVEFGNSPILIGERINPTGKKRFKEAVRNSDINYILEEGISQKEKGAEVLDVNVGLPEIDEASFLTTVVTELQAVIDLPLQIDTANPQAMESALRRYNGKAMINSVNGKVESMEAVFPLAKKYGGVIVALTLDEEGIPDSAQKRLEIAARILKKAEEYGIDKKDIIFDPLALSVSADNLAAKETLCALGLIKKELGCHTSLGVSNVSFGLPERDVINSAFFTLALGAGLSAAIMNPHSSDMMRAYFSYRVLAGQDENCLDYIAYASELSGDAAAAEKVEKNKQDRTPLATAVIKGLREQAAKLSENMLKEKDPLAIISEEIIPALDVVGVDFEKNVIYLPQLLMSAEAAKSAFDVIKGALSAERGASKGSIVLATVKGDIHDIGKNIVKLLLENYGFDVTDLGRDVPPEKVLEAVKTTHASIVGLSALMTTTVASMEETIKLLRKEAPLCKVVVGGAVLNQEYADAIGADKYAKDAMETVRYAEEIYSLQK